MSVTITVADPLAEQLRTQARTQHLSLEEFVSALLQNALRFFNQPALTPEDVVARIRATTPTAANMFPATGSLRDALRHAPDDPDFDLASWEKAWVEIEREMKAVTSANAIAEGLKSSFPCYFSDETDAERAAELQIALRRKGWQLETVDAFIAVTALRYDLILLTTDRDFQAVPELLKQNWKTSV